MTRLFLAALRDGVLWVWFLALMCFGFMFAPAMGAALGKVL